MVHNHGHLGASLLHRFDSFSEQEISSLKQKDNAMLQKAQSKVKTKTAKKPMLQDEEVNYCSGFGFEDHPPLSNMEEFSDRDTNPWNQVPDDTLESVASEDELDFE